MNEMECDINEFYVRFNLGHFDDPCKLAKALEALSNKAWDEVDNLINTYPQSMIP